MGIRGAGHRFMPNRLVFPGGAVDPEDRTAPVAAEPNPDALAHLARAAKPPLARALAHAAARELHEETGLHLGIPPRLDTLHYLCRAITPPAQPIRFNARFFVAAASAAQGTLADTHELHELRWHGVSDMLTQGLMLVTQHVLQQLARWLELPEAARASRAPEVFRNRSWSTDRQPSLPEPTQPAIIAAKRESQ